MLAAGILAMGTPIVYSLFKKKDKEDGTWEPERYNIDEPTAPSATSRSAPVQLHQERIPVPPPPTPTFQPPDQVQSLAINASYGMDLGRYSKNIVVNKTRESNVPVENKYTNMWIPDYDHHTLKEILFTPHNRGTIVFTKVDPKEARILNPSIQQPFVQTSGDVVLPGKHNQTMGLVGQTFYITKIKNAIVNGKRMHMTPLVPNYGTPVTAEDAQWIRQSKQQRAMGDAILKENGTLFIHPGLKVSQMFDMDEDTDFVLQAIPASEYSGEVGDRAMNLQNGAMQSKTDSVVRQQPPESTSTEHIVHGARRLARAKNQELLNQAANTGRTDFQIDVRESMQRPDITAQQAARMHRGFAVRTQGRSYVEPERFVNDRLDLSTEHNWHVTNTTREDHSTPWSKHRPAKEPVVQLHNSIYEKQERAMDRLAHSEYEFNRAYGSRYNLKKQERPVQLVREPRRHKDTDINNNEIHATEAVMRKTFTHNIARDDKQYVNGRAEGKRDETKRLRAPAKHMELQQRPGVEEKSNRSSRRKPLGGYYGGTEEPQSRYYFEAAGARTERPREYTQHRGGQGSNVRKSKAVVRLNRLVTVPGMTVSRAPEQRFLDGKVITQHDRRVLARKNYRSRPKQIQRDQFKSTLVQKRGGIPKDMNHLTAKKVNVYRDRNSRADAKPLYTGGFDHSRSTQNSTLRHKRSAYVPEGKTARKSQQTMGNLVQKTASKPARMVRLRDGATTDVRERSFHTPSNVPWKANLSGRNSINPRTNDTRDANLTYRDGSKIDRMIPGRKQIGLEQMERVDQDDTIYTVRGEGITGEMLPTMASQTMTHEAQLDNQHFREKASVNRVGSNADMTDNIDTMLGATREENSEAVRSAHLSTIPEGAEDMVAPHRLHVPRDAARTEPNPLIDVWKEKNTTDTAQSIPEPREQATLDYPRVHFTGNLGEENTLIGTGVDHDASPNTILVPKNKDIETSVQTRLPLYNTEHLQREE